MLHSRGFCGRRILEVCLLFYGYIFDGVDPATGNSIYRDIDTIAGLSDGDKTIIGNANPDYTFGLTNTFTYKGWSFIKLTASCAVIKPSSVGTTHTSTRL